MSQKTVSRQNQQLIETTETLELLNEANLPGVSTIRFSRSLNEIEERVQEVRESLKEIERNHFKTDRDGDPIVEVFLSNGEKIGETPVVEETGPRGGTQISEYKELDLEDIDWSERDGVDENQFGGVPPTRERYIFEDEEEMMAEKEKTLKDPVDFEVHEFPEEEFEKVITAFKEQKAKQQAQELTEKLGLDPEEDEEKIQTIQQVLRPSEKDTRLRPSEIKTIEFLFPEDL